MPAPAAEYPNPRALRVRLGLSQPAMARACGVSVSTVCHWEHGLRRPSEASAVKLRALAGETRS